VLSEEDVEGYLHGLITGEILKEYLEEHHQNVYVCGPEPMMEMVLDELSDLGVDEGSIVREDL